MCHCCARSRPSPSTTAGAARICWVRRPAYVSTEIRPDNCGPLSPIYPGLGSLRFDGSAGLDRPRLARGRWRKA